MKVMHKLFSNSIIQLLISKCETMLNRISMRLRLKNYITEEVYKQKKTWSLFVYFGLFVRFENAKMYLYVRIRA